MQKIAGLAAVLFGLSAASALAQAPAEPPPPPKAPPEINASNPPPPPPPGPKGPDRDMGPRADMGHRPPPPPPPPRERGARFHIEDGRTRIDIRCADGEPTKSCGDVVLQILDRLQTPSADDNNSDRNDRDRSYDRDRYERR